MSFAGPIRIPPGANAATTARGNMFNANAQHASDITSGQANMPGYQPPAGMTPLPPGNNNPVAPNPYGGSPGNSTSQYQPPGGPIIQYPVFHVPPGTPTTMPYQPGMTLVPPGKYNPVAPNPYGGPPGNRPVLNNFRPMPSGGSSQYPVLYAPPSTPNPTSPTTPTPYSPPASTGSQPSALQSVLGVTASSPGNSPAGAAAVSPPPFAPQGNPPTQPASTPSGPSFGSSPAGNGNWSSYRPTAPSSQPQQSSNLSSVLNNSTSPGNAPTSSIPSQSYQSDSGLTVSSPTGLDNDPSKWLPGQTVSHGQTYGSPSPATTPLPGGNANGLTYDPSTATTSANGKITSAAGETLYDPNGTNVNLFGQNYDMRYPTNVSNNQMQSNQNGSSSLSPALMAMWKNMGFIK